MPDKSQRHRCTYNPFTHSRDDVDADDMTAFFQKFLLNRYHKKIKRILEEPDVSEHYGLAGSFVSNPFLLHRIPPRFCHYCFFLLLDKSPDLLFLFSCCMLSLHTSWRKVDIPLLLEDHQKYGTMVCFYAADMAVYFDAALKQVRLIYSLGSPYRHICFL